MIVLREPWLTIVVGGGFLTGLASMFCGVICSVDGVYRQGWQRFWHRVACSTAVAVGGLLLFVALAVADEAVGWNPL